MEYGVGPLFVGGCIVTVQCTLRRDVALSYKTTPNLYSKTPDSLEDHVLQWLVPTRYKTVHVTPTARRPSMAKLNEQRR